MKTFLSKIKNVKLVNVEKRAIHKYLVYLCIALILSGCSNVQMYESEDEFGIEQTKDIEQTEEIIKEEIIKEIPDNRKELEDEEFLDYLDYLEVKKTGIPLKKESKEIKKIKESKEKKEIRKGKNPTKEEIFDEMVKVGKRELIPPEILLAICFLESECIQFNENGTPFISYGGIGLMQITPGHEAVNFDLQRVKYDWRYNIEVGAKILNEKKDWERIPKIGSGNPLIIENWYFILWAYNGFALENNPNKLPMYSKSLKGIKKIAYQDKIFDFIRKIFKINIKNIDKRKLPKNSLPLSNKTYNTPNNYNISIIGREY